ncbi:MAG: tRNA pseudouridine(55) synthase TruB [Candidatus Omnitrophota bacterium]|nr:tRNA pseudouridine(55) synthase TruB [Candidatus Omnitrophota bacterium]
MDGILIVDKPQGLTSHDVVDFIRKRFSIKKVGHAGTLDPMATGLLIILIGNYTKHSNRFLNGDKEYDATMTLGATSDTGDAWGKIIPSAAFNNAAVEDIEGAFNKFLGPIEQAVPSYSAKKFKGKKLYELARKGIEIKLEPKKIVIHSLKITRINLPEISFKVNCSKGTYIRQLCMDIGAVLGCGAYMSKLHRTGSGGINMDDAISIEELKGIDAQALGSRLKAL